MKIFKQLLFTLFSIFLLYRTIELLQYLHLQNPSNFSFLEVLIQCFLITLFITGIVAFPGFVFSTNKLLSDSYYQIKNPIHLKRVYQIFNVDLFKKLLLLLFWGTKRNRKKYFDGSRKGIANLIFQSKQSEFGHLIAFFLIFITSIYLLIEIYFMMFAIVSVVNLIGNIYPVILQRHHRMRIERIAKEIE